MVEFLEEAGALVVGPIGWIDEAVAFLEKDAEKLDGAVLDINLIRSTSTVARRCLQLSRNVSREQTFSPLCEFS